MVDLGYEGAFGWSEGVVYREHYVYEEDSSSIWGIIGTDNLSHPMMEVRLLIERHNRTVGGRVLLQLNELLLDSFERH